MKKYIYYSIFTILIFGCGSSSDEEVVNTNPHNLQELGLTENNKYPFYPDTIQYLGSNQWNDYKHGDTLIVHRRDNVYDDSSDELFYTFLTKPNQWIVPLSFERIRCDGYLGIPCYRVFKKPITNIKLQNYIENKVLACQIETPNGDYSQSQYPLIDKMWIDLSN